MDRTPPADAGVKIYPSSPALGTEAAAGLCAALDKLMLQFQREGNVGDWWTDQIADGAIVVVAWTDAGPEGLSGCRKDKMAKVVELHGARHGAELLAPPPIWLQRGEVVEGLDGAGLRELVEVGRVDEATPAFDTMATRWADWSAACPAPIEDIPWLAQKLARIRRRLAS